MKISSIKILLQFLKAFVLSPLSSEDPLERTDILPVGSVGDLGLSPGTGILCPGDIFKDDSFTTAHTSQGKTSYAF